MARDRSGRSDVHRVLKAGTRGDDVKRLQHETNQRANAHGLSRIAEDGVYGPRTDALAKDVAYIYGALQRNIDRPGLIESLQRIIRYPGRRSPAQIARALKRRKPPMVTAAQIGLSFQNVFGAKGPVTRLAGHYTAGDRVAGKTALIAEMRADHAYHMSKGWGGLSYEVMIADDGTIGFGNPMFRKAAAVALNNTGMVGVCCPGTTGDRMTAAQLRSVRWLLANWHTSKVPAAHRLPRRAHGLDMRGHKEFPSQSTACPGDMLVQYHGVFQEA